eukprot:m.168501 g.168501  ORF g.168501 m.168501 type:complete len:89 (-) comp14752_c0_seq3:32-298(-)
MLKSNQVVSTYVSAAIRHVASTHLASEYCCARKRADRFAVCADVKFRAPSRCGDLNIADYSERQRPSQLHKSLFSSISPTAHVLLTQT